MATAPRAAEGGGVKLAPEVRGLLIVFTGVSLFMIGGTIIFKIALWIYNL